jgi:hypothetical protein
MQPLKDVILALRREIDEALAEGSKASASNEVRVIRISLCLDVEMQEQPAANGATRLNFGVRSATGGASTSAGSPHRLTIDFEAGHSSPKADAEAVRPMDQPDGIAESCIRIFGPPGFDNAARTEVFREAIEDLTANEVREVVASMANSSAKLTDARLDRVKTQIQRLLTFSPCSSKEAVALLARVFARNEPADVVRILLEQWKSPSAWTGKNP